MPGPRPELAVEAQPCAGGASAAGAGPTREHAEALRRREEKLRLAEDAARMGSWDWDIATDELVWSDRCKELFGLPRDAAPTYEVFLAALHPDDRPRVDRLVQAALAACAEYDAEMRVPLPGGGVRWIASKGRAFADGAGRAARMAGMVLDVTDRRLAEEALREQLALKEQLAKIAESVPGVICSYRLRPDGTACFPFATAAAEEVWGLSPESLAPDAGPLFANIHPGDVERVNRVILEAAAALSRWHDVFRYQHPRKGLRWLEGWSAPKAEPGGSIVWHGYVMDVTERVLAEEAVRAADQRKTEFLGVLSHELRNPLAPIRNSIHVLERVPADSPQAARAKEVALRQTDHLARLVDDLLDVTRISRGKIQLQRAQLDLRDLVRRTCEDHRSLFEQSELDLHIDLPPGPVGVEADAARLGQIVGNLLHNATKFTPAGGRVTVAVRAREGQAQVAVRDTGVGMDPAQVERMFEPFSQGERTLARTHAGLGLGLALAKGLAELHGGSLAARSDGAGCGSEFLLSLPLVAPASRAAPAAAAGAPPGPARHVLIIEDNVDAAQSLADVLELDGHRVRLARDGASGIALARELRPDVVLCDIGLPDLDGYEVARTLRGDDALRATRLVALSGYAQPEDRQRAREAGFDAHLAKPPPLDVLGALLA